MIMEYYHICQDTKNYLLSDFEQDTESLPIVLQKYLHSCIKNLDIQSQILREIIRHFNFKNKILGPQSLLILKYSPEKFNFKLRKGDKLEIDPPSYEENNRE